MHPCAGGRADARLHDVDERRDVVIGDLLTLVHGRDVDAGTLAHGASRVGRHDSEVRPGLDREHLHLEPRPEARLVGEQVGDLGGCVAGDH